MNIPIDQILPVFFAAMQNGYAGSAPKSTIAELHGSKVIRYKQGDFEVVDCYFVTSISDYSFGTTTIYYQGNAVWMMQYRGQYPKDVIPFLKQALRQTYEKSEFVGGRGPIIYFEGGTIDTQLRYSNNVISGDWRNFLGREEIYRSCGGNQGAGMQGWHEYGGLLLI